MNTLETQHEDVIHDAQLDYYGKVLATCSSDATVRLFEVSGDRQTPLETLHGHQGPVWQVAWAHPKFGQILASCGYDARVLIWRNLNNTWTQVKEHAVHAASVNAIAWAPHEYGLVLACASSDSKVSILTFRPEDGEWDSVEFPAHSIGVNTITWAPAYVPGSLLEQQPATTPGNSNGATMPSGGGPPPTASGASSLPAAHLTGKRLATGGCDNLIKVWTPNPTTGAWEAEAPLTAHTDWVRGVAWAPNMGLPVSLLASCGQDRCVLIWSQDRRTGTWSHAPLRAEPFPDVVWNVSWSAMGNLLAVACGDNHVSLWKQDLQGEWTQLAPQAAAQAAAGAGMPAQPTAAPVHAS
ncbi:hypothetical protein CXG81DRAFT_29213 [Caulochytrium protostelioides]|uniref:Uncharacterized protein n=1 Tax=Caulochytrium protostelioides TaxID=1555241 RepID=A0A4P9XDL8_9FUNG|nr:hypothetical protein CXG81DRAFT_29213 [Caulochytrium protostelioides]|eukprot:RKP03614.1 hypothetical protein CXG81DRAFT_29213 [Caulochytrium protostelioides]